VKVEGLERLDGTTTSSRYRARLMLECGVQGNESNSRSLPSDIGRAKWGFVVVGMSAFGGGLSIGGTEASLLLL